MMERLVKENQRQQSIQNSMLYRTVRKEKREIVRNIVEKKVSNSFSFENERRKIFRWKLEENQRHHSIQSSILKEKIVKNCVSKKEKSDERKSSVFSMMERL